MLFEKLEERATAPAQGGSQTPEEITLGTMIAKAELKQPTLTCHQQPNLGCCCVSLAALLGTKEMPGSREVGQIVTHQGSEVSGTSGF